MHPHQRRRRAAGCTIVLALAASLLTSLGATSQAAATAVRAAEEPQGTAPRRSYDRSDLPEPMRAMAATERWYTAGTDMGTTTNCVLQYSELLGRSWVGYYGEIGRTPTTDQPRYYTAIGWGVSGNPCGGGAQVHIEQFLPPSSQLAINAQNPVVCWYEGLDADTEFARVSEAEGCPQVPQNGLQGGLAWDPSTGGGAWPTATGAMFEIWVPIRTTKPLNGLMGNPCKSCLTAGVWMIDGVHSPWRFPTMGVNVVGAAPDTQITSGPPAKTRKRKATFTFTATKATKTFKCKLDTGKWKGCSTGSITYSKLRRTKHTFAVKAIDLAGRVDRTPAKRSWTITR